MKKHKPSKLIIGLRCVDYEFTGEFFHAVIDRIENGAFLYAAKCPVCGSLKVLHLPGVTEENLRIGAVTSSKQLFLKPASRGI